MFIEILKKVLENDDLSIENLTSLFNKAFSEICSNDIKLYLEKDPYEDLEINLFLNEEILKEFYSKLNDASEERKKLIASTTIHSPFPDYNFLDNYLYSYCELLIYIIFSTIKGYELLSKDSMETILNSEKHNDKILFYSPRFLMLYKICLDAMPHYLALIKDNPSKKELYKSIFVCKAKEISFALTTANKRLYHFGLNDESLCFDMIPYDIPIVKIDTCMVIMDIFDKIEEKIKSSQVSSMNINILVLGEIDKNDIPLLDSFLQHLSIKYNLDINVNLTLTNIFNENEIIYNSKFLRIIKKGYDGELSSPESIQKLESSYDMIFVLNFFDLYKRKYNSSTQGLSAYCQEIRDFYNKRGNHYIAASNGLNSMLNILSNFIANDNSKLLEGNSEYVRRILDKCKINYIISFFEKKGNDGCTFSLYDSIVGKQTQLMGVHESKLLTRKGKIFLTDTSLNNTIFANNVKDTFTIEFSLLDVYLFFKDILPFSEKMLTSVNAMLNTRFCVVYDKFCKYNSGLSRIIYNIDGLNEAEKNMVQKFIFEEFYPLFSLVENYEGDEYHQFIYGQFKKLFYYNTHTVADITFLEIFSDRQSLEIFRSLEIRNADFVSKEYKTKCYADRYPLLEFIKATNSPGYVNPPIGIKQYGWNNYDLYDRIIESCDRICFDKESVFCRNLRKLKER